jgi:hypothetical protein
MRPILNDAYLNDVYPGHDVDVAERMPANRVYRPSPRAFPCSSGLKNRQITSDRAPSITRRKIHTLGRFCVAVLIGVSAATLIGVGATLSWRSFDGEMVKAWAPSLGRLLPASPSAGLQAQLKPVATDLAVTERSVEPLATNQDQLARKQDQIKQAFATLRGAVQDTNQYALATAPLKVAAVPLSKPKAALVPLPKSRPAVVPLSKPKAALVPPPKPAQSREIVLESATASDSGWSGRFGRASLDSDSRTLVGAAVR